MMYKILANCVTVNGNTYRKGQEVSGIRFSSGQVTELTSSKSIEPVGATPIVAAPAPEVEAKASKKK